MVLTILAETAVDERQPCESMVEATNLPSSSRKSYRLCFVLVVTAARNLPVKQRSSAPAL